MDTIAQGSLKANQASLNTTRVLSLPRKARPSTYRESIPALSEPDPRRLSDVFKVGEEITFPSYAKQPRYGARAGQPNPWFLDAELFNELVLTPFREASFVFRCRTGCGMFARYASRASRGLPTPCFNVLRLSHM